MPSAQKAFLSTHTKQQAAEWFALLESDNPADRKKAAQMADDIWWGCTNAHDTLSDSSTMNAPAAESPGQAE
jgi:hypothetical protein